MYPPSREFVCCDLRTLDRRLQDGAVDEIAAQDVLEYLPWRQLDGVLIVLAKKLKPEGTLFLQVPDDAELLREFADGAMPAEQAQEALFGGDHYPAQRRHSLWTASLLERRLEMAGLKIERLLQDGAILQAWAQRLS
jgi:hypothetical protein